METASPSEQTRVDLTPDPGDPPERLDRFIARKIPGIGRAGAKQTIRNGGVRLNGRVRPPATLVRPGDRVLVQYDPRLAEDWAPLAESPEKLEVVSADEHLVVLDKPAGLPCHPLEPDETGTLANSLAALFPECVESSRLGGGLAREAGLCHRLDNQTSGLIVAARNPEAFKRLRKAFSSGQVTKYYLAWVSGVAPPDGVVDRPIQMPRRGRKKVRVVDGETRNASSSRGRSMEARTEYRSVASEEGRTVVAIRTNTGRRHQVRVHMAHIGHPLCGDRQYGGPDPLSGRTGFFLRAARLSFPHPGSGRPVTYDAPEHESWAPLGSGDATSVFDRWSLE